jgi:hypothetical protein
MKENLALQTKRDIEDGCNAVSAFFVVLFFRRASRAWSSHTSCSDDSVFFFSFFGDVAIENGKLFRRGIGDSLRSFQQRADELKA